MADYKPQPKQYRMHEVLTEDNGIKYLLYGGAAGGGKTYGGVATFITLALKYNNSTWFMARKRKQDLMDSTFLTFKKISKKWGIDNRWTYKGQPHYMIEFDNGSTIKLMDVAYNPSDPDFDDLGSKEYTGGFIEEAQEVHEKAFNVLKTRINRNNIFTINGEEIHVPPKMLLTANPHKGYLKRMFVDVEKDGMIPTSTKERLKLQKEYKDKGEKIPNHLQIEFIQALYTDNEYLPKDYGDDLETGDKAQTQRLKYGDWDYDDSQNSLVSFDALEDLYTNTIIGNNERYISVDVARYGGDRVVLNVWEGLKSIKRVVKKKQGVDITAKNVRELEMEHRVPRSHVVVDDDGVGGGVVDLLKGCKSFVNNSTPFKAKPVRRQVVASVEPGRTVVNFTNLKSQCGFKLAEMIEDRKIVVEAEGNEIDVITEELSAALRKKDTGDGKLALIPKETKNQNEESVKKILGRSPDVADTFIMRMYFEILKTNPGGELSDIRRTPVINTRKFIKKGV